MNEKGIGPAFAMGTLAALGIGFGLFLSVIFADMTSDPGTGDLFVTMLGVVAIAFTGAVLIGALAGIVAGLRSTDQVSGAGAGLLAGAAGHFLVLFLVFLAISMVFSSEEEVDTADEGLSWSEFGEALLFLLPASVTGAITAVSVAPPSNGEQGPPSRERATEEPSEPSAIEIPPR